MDNIVIIKIESGVVANIYATSPVQAIIVDYDMIEGGETLKERMKKSVLSMTPDHCIKPDKVEATTRSLVLECSRPADRGKAFPTNDEAEVAA
jgi:hypothetical protein